MGCPGVVEPVNGRLLLSQVHSDVESMEGVALRRWNMQKYPPSVDLRNLIVHFFIYIVASSLAFSIMYHAMLCS